MNIVKITQASDKSQYPIYKELKCTRPKIIEKIKKSMWHR